MEPRTNPLLVGLIFGAGLLAAAQFGKIALTLPEVAAALDRPLPLVAPLVSLVGLMGLVLGVLAGGIVAALGPGRTFVIGLVLGGMMSLLQAMLPPFGLFAASRGIEGMAHLALVVAGPPLMAGAASDRARPLVMGLWALFFGASLAISAQLFPYVLTAGGLPLLFAGHGVLMLGLAVALRRLWRDKGAGGFRANPLALHRAVYGDLRAMAPGLGFVCYTFTFIAAIAVLPEALGRPGLATTLPLLSLATTLAGGALCRRFAPHWVAFAGYVGTVAGMLGAAAGVPFALEGAFAAMGLVPGASFAAIPALNPETAARARATGAIAQLGNLGTVTGTPVLVLVWQAAGVGAVLATLVGVAALGGVLAVWAGRAARRVSG